MKDVDYYLSLNYRWTVYRDEDADFIIEVPDLPGCVADGRNPAEAYENLKGAMKSWIESRLAAGLEVPEPRSMEEYSGRLLVRMPKSLHARLAQTAGEEGVSLNQHIVSLLSAASANTQVAALYASRWADISWVHATNLSASQEPWRGSVQARTNLWPASFPGSNRAYHISFCNFAGGEPQVPELFECRASSGSRLTRIESVAQAWKPRQPQIA